MGEDAFSDVLLLMLVLVDVLKKRKLVIYQLSFNQSSLLLQQAYPQQNLD